MSTPLVVSPDVAVNGVSSLGQPHDSNSNLDSDTGTCPAPDAMLETARAHETHHQGGDVSADYHEQEGADTEVGKGEGDASTDGPILVIVMGVSGSGKSTLGAALASALGLPFTDADALHPKANIEKMRTGTPLTDADRQPWLEIVRKSAVETCEKQAHETADVAEKAGAGVEGPKAHGVVVGCSALKKKYRDVLSGSFPHNLPESCSCTCDDKHCPCCQAGGGFRHYVATSLQTYFVYIKGARAELLQRMENRKDHFMKASMLDSQLRDLESPDEDDEKGVVVVPLDVSTEEQVRIAKEGLTKLSALRSE